MTAAPLDRDRLRKQVIDTILKDDNGHIDTATIDAIMQLAEEYARSVCVAVIGEDERYMQRPEDLTIMDRNHLRAEQRKRLEDRLQ